MRKSSKPNRWANTRAYRKAQSLVDALLHSPQRLLDLLERATKKSESQPNGSLGKTLESVKVMIRLVTAYAKGDYRAIALDNLALIVAALVYFVMPLDALPDFIAMLGLMDDAALLAWTWGAVKDEVERFLQWELAQEKLAPAASKQIEQIHHDKSADIDPSKPQ